MVTTIQISNDLLEQLKSMKRHDKESYEDIIWDLIEDKMELSEETKKDIEKSMKEYAQGKTVTLEELRKELKHVPRRVVAKR